MKTQIDNNQRKFLVQSQGFGNQSDVFCNLADVPKVIRNTIEPNADYKVFEYWNRKLKLVSKKHLKELYAANQVDPTQWIETIDIKALEWFDKVNGNSYFAATVTLNYGQPNEQIIKLPFQYGYGTHYIDMCFKEIEKAGHATKVRHYDNGSNEGLQAYCERNRIALRYTKHKNCKRAELKNL